VMLQLSGYGYASRGCPYWLLQGLRRWKRLRPGGRLLTMFHETYASGPVWSRSYWVSLAQKIVIGGIARLSDVAVTNIDRHRAWLERCDPSKGNKIPVLRVPSNVGEAVAPSELLARRRSLVVFGLAASRRRSYEIRMRELQSACEQLRIEEVHDVGPPLEQLPQRIGWAPVTRHGHMHAEELTSLLSQSMAGFVDYTPKYMAKSGVFAAYCAHRMLAISPHGGSSEADGIRSGVHYCNAGESAAAWKSTAAQAIADAAWHWYQGHSALSHARVLASMLGVEPSPECMASISGRREAKA